MSQEPPGIDDFEEINWQQTLKQAEKRNVDRYQDLFFEKAKDLEESGDDSESQAYRLLGDICNMHMHKDDHNNPFEPHRVTSNGRSAIIEDFSDEDLDVLNELLADIEDPEFKARVADVIWTRQRDHKVAETAFEAYLESAEYLLDPDSWSTSFDRIERAFQIAAMLQNEDLRKDGRDFVIGILDDLDAEDGKFLSYNLLKLLLEHDLGDLDDLSQRAEEAAENAEEEEDWKKAKKVWLLKADIDGDRDEDDIATDAKIRAGEAIVTQAEVVQQGSNSAAAHHFREAVEVFRRAGASEKAEQIHKRLLDAQEKYVGELGRVGGTVDLSDAAQEAREAVSVDHIEQLTTADSRC